MDYIGAYVALGHAPQYIYVEPDLLIEVLGMDDGGIHVRLEKGLSSEDYMKAWKAFKKFLGQPTPYAIKEDELKNKIYLDHKGGDTPSIIAKRYFPNEYKTPEGKLAARDKVKKIIARFKS